MNAPPRHVCLNTWSQLVMLFGIWTMLREVGHGVGLEVSGPVLLPVHGLPPSAAGLSSLLRWSESLEV